MKRFITVMCLCVVVCGAFSVSFAARYPIIWLVNWDESEDFATIQAALDNEELLPWDHISVADGTYNGDITIEGKSNIKIYGRDQLKPDINGQITISSDMNLSENIEINSFSIEKLAIHGGNDIRITKCFIKKPGETPLEIYSFYGEITATIKDCYINMDGQQITYGPVVGTSGNNYIEARFDNCTIENCQYGIVADYNGEDTKEFDIWIISMTSDNFPLCDRENGSYSPYIIWHWLGCERCPTYFQTRNYPSNYNNNDTISAVLDPPSNGGYNVVVNGETESGSDNLYIWEMDGTLITMLSGTKSNHKEWIDSERSVKVEFISNSSVTYKGYEVTVESSWETGIWYDVDNVVNYNGGIWINTFAHTSQVDWYPGAPGLWFWEVLESPLPGNWTTNVWYVLGNEVLYNGETWKCVYAHTSQVDWYPGAPGLWFWEVQE